jgi:hypothetical protein
MSPSLDRRRFLAGSVALPAALSSAPVLQDEPREWYVLSRYRLDSAANRALLLDHLAGALLPALKRAGLDRVGVFVAAHDGEDHDVHVLLPSRDLERLVTLDEVVAGDGEYSEATRAWSAGGAVYTRIESRLLHAFASIPVIEAPGEAGAYLELRTYESKNADAARRKVLMFDEGETQLMRDVGLAPVFFGATRVGHDAPNLTYMLSAESPAAHKEHWKAFLSHPEWDRIKVLPRYADTVSKISNWFLQRADCSQL